MSLDFRGIWPDFRENYNVMSPPSHTHTQKTSMDGNPMFSCQHFAILYPKSPEEIVQVS